MTQIGAAGTDRAAKANFARGSRSMNEGWKTFRVDSQEIGWEPASYNVKWEDGREYGRWRRVLRQHSHGLTVISRYSAPPGKAWKIVGKASQLGEEVYILDGHYYDTRGARGCRTRYVYVQRSWCHSRRDFLRAYTLDPLLQRQAGRDRIDRLDRFPARPRD